MRYRLVLPVLCACTTLSIASAAETSPARPHPRLLITPEQLPELRAVAGVGRELATSQPVAQPAAQREALQRLRQAAREIMRGEPGPDDLVAPAVLHLIDGASGVPDEYSEYVAAQLLNPSRTRFEIDAILALDYCWDALDRDVLAMIAARILPTLQGLDPRQSPFDHLSFYERLCSLAAAIVLDDPFWGTGRPELATRLRSVHSLGRLYLADSFVRLCRQRGAAPTSGDEGTNEEADFTLAIELLRSDSRQTPWPELADSFGRAMEHYFYAETQHPALAHGFVHDDASTAPGRPASTMRGFAPAVPFVLAHEAHDPVAAWFARRSLRPSATLNLNVDRYQWVRLLYPPPDREAARRNCPLGRNLGGGWIAMRSGWDGGDTVVLFDAGQPFWRSRQHFDAGQFQVWRRGRLAIDSGDDVAFDAVPPRGGRTLIGGQPGDWDDYAQATIAHNCVTVADQMAEMKFYGRQWIALGNQRLIERDCTPTEGDISKTARHTADLTAFETNTHYTYAATDLTAAYPKTTVRSLRRQVLFLHAGAILVLDRVEPARPRFTATFNLQLPGQPHVFVPAPSGQAQKAATPEGVTQKIAFAGCKQLHGVSMEAGIWELDAGSMWIEVAQADGVMFVSTLLPAGAHRRLMGGPMRRRQIADGPMKGTGYYGGDPAGYEHRLWPAAILLAPNAAYELGRPTSLGPQFGVGATWGRYDVSPTEQGPSVTFLHLLIPGDKGMTAPPEVECEASDAGADVKISMADRLIQVSLRFDKPTGTVLITDTAKQAKLVESSLTTKVDDTTQMPVNTDFSR